MELSNLDEIILNEADEEPGKLKSCGDSEASLGKSSVSNHKWQFRRRFCKRADHRTEQNYLNGTDSLDKNALLQCLDGI